MGPSGVGEDKNTKVTERDTMPRLGSVGPSGSVAASLHDHLLSLLLFESVGFLGWCSVSRLSQIPLQELPFTQLE